MEKDAAVSSVAETLDRYARVDDVWSPSFMPTIIIQSPYGSESLTTELETSLRDRGARNIYVHYFRTQESRIPPGPYFLQFGSVHETYRLYPDVADAFVVATVQINKTDS